MSDFTEPRILCVDDEPNVLAGLERVLGFDYEVSTATSGARALAMIEAADEPYAVVMSDMRMPEMDGAALLSKVREVTPDSVRILLTGHADMSAAIAAVNNGGIFRFLTKPCPGPQLIQSIEEACEHHRLVLAEQELLDKTLRGAVRVMTELLSLVNPGAFSRGERVGAMMRTLAEETFAEDPWELELAGLLSQIGCVVVPPEILAKVDAGEGLDEDEAKVYREHPRLAYELLNQIPRLDRVASMIYEQGGAAGASHAEDVAIRRGAELLKLAIELDQGMRDGSSLAEASARIRSDAYGDRVITSLQRIADRQPTPRNLSVSVEELNTDMVLDQDVKTCGGVLLMAKGQRVTNAVISRLSLISRRQGVVQPIAVQLTPSEDE